MDINKKFIGFIIFILLIPITYSNGGCIKVADDIFVQLSSAPLVPVVNKQTSFLFSFGNKEGLIKEEINGKLWIAKDEEKILTKDFKVKDGIYDLKHTFKNPGLYEIFLEFNFNNKTYAPEDFLIEVKEEKSEEKPKKTKKAKKTSEEATEAVEPMEAPGLPPVDPTVDSATPTATEAVRAGEGSGAGTYAPDLAPESEPRWLRLGLAPPKRRSPEPVIPVAIEGSVIKTPPFIFEPWSTNLSDQDRAILEKIATIMKGQPEAVPKLKVAAYTDNSGDPAINEALTIARANVVKAYLILKEVGVHRLEAHGFGEANPLVSNDTKEGRVQNRRVEFHILK